MAGWKAYTKKDGLISNLIYSSAMDLDGRVWFGGRHPDGVCRFDGRSWQRYTIDDCELGPGHVWDIAVDRKGQVWFGTAGGGVTRYDGASWRRYTMEEGLAGNHVYAIGIGLDGRIWLGCAPEPDCVLREGGVSVFDGSHFLSFTSDYTQGSFVGGGNSGLCDNRVYAITFDRDGNVWFGTKGGGICRFDGTEWVTYSQSGDLPCNEVGDGAAALDNQGHVWFGLRGGGVCRFNGETWSAIDMNSGLAGNFVYAIKTGPDDNLWFGCAPDPDKVTGEGGVSIFDGETFTNYKSDYTGGRYVGGGNSPLVDNRVYAITFDHDGNAWFGTKGGGVSRLARESITGKSKGLG
jgi:ligand-binding sensor domain-containing protein